MSILIHRAHKSPRFGSGGRRAYFQSALRTIFSVIREAVWRGGKLIVAAAEVIADARRQRAMMEAEIYFYRYSDRTIADSRKSTVAAAGDRKSA